MLLFGASMKLMHGPRVVEGFTKFGYAEKSDHSPWRGRGSLRPYLRDSADQRSWPSSARDISGAIATHVRAGGLAPALILGVIVWAEAVPAIAGCRRCCRRMA